MSRKPSFVHLRDAKPTSGEPRAGEKDESRVPAARPHSRTGRKQIAGFFSPDMSFALHILARRQGRSVQSLMAEAFNDVLRKYDESPVGD